MGAIMERDGCDPNTLAHVRRAEAAAGVDLLPLGLWGDGVPCQWGRAESIEAISLNLPGQRDEYKQLRLPVVSLPKKHTSAHTWHDIFEVLSWSFRALASGISPTTRHDGSPWIASDRWRERRNPDRASAPPILQRAALCEVRADWVFHTAVFHLPAHNRTMGNCWRCDHTPAEVIICMPCIILCNQLDHHPAQRQGHKWAYTHTLVQHRVTCMHQERNTPAGPHANSTIFSAAG